MKHDAQEKKRRIAAYKVFVKSNPPAMPDDFSHKDYKRVINYARVAFITGWNSGINDICAED